MTAPSDTTRSFLTILALGLGIALGGCRNEPAPEPSPTPTQSEAPRSIFQPQNESEEAQQDTPEVVEPLRMTIGFPEGGAALDEAAQAALERALESTQMAQDWPIVLRGHSDAGGSDEVNIRASRARAEAVRDALVEGGIAEDRITVIAFGEQNPVEPNALADGEPNEAGRAANRRVELTIDPPEGIVTSPSREKTIIEEIATPAPGPSPLTSPMEGQPTQSSPTPGAQRR